MKPFASGIFARQSFDDAMRLVDSYSFAELKGNELRRSPGWVMGIYIDFDNRVLGASPGPSELIFPDCSRVILGSSRYPRCQNGG